MATFPCLKELIGVSPGSELTFAEAVEKGMPSRVSTSSVLVRISEGMFT